jgi:regulator of sirC expression with transglutaminase-like and TPR domain
MDTLTGLGVLDDDDLDLIEAAIALGACDHPCTDLTPYRQHLDDIASTCLNLVQGRVSAIARAEILAIVIANHHGYQGDRTTYDDPRNANLLDVIDRKRGLPVALSILYLGIARRLGWEAAGLNVPAHFLIRIGAPDASVLQDPFDGGSLIAPGDVPARLKSLGLRPDQMTPSAFSALPDRAVLVRLLNNLAARAEHAGDHSRALVLHERMTAVAPNYTGLWWERARLEQGMGQLAAARASLAHMLETTRDPDLTRRINQALDGLARSLN